ncbi:hypothetical protein GCM10020221_09710 [Streptomyces thioluteus]|uniref:Uncharacterized protein n=1 Tax=Streptomyces thioluteus TaxID=66431 RepID=A0ABP6J0E9_STRTU
MDGSLALLVQRSDQTDRQLADHEERLDALERTRWPLASIAALTALAGLCHLAPPTDGTLGLAPGPFAPRAGQRGCARVRPQAPDGLNSPSGA